MEGSPYLGYYFLSPTIIYGLDIPMTCQRAGDYEGMKWEPREPSKFGA